MLQMCELANCRRVRGAVRENQTFLFLARVWMYVWVLYVCMYVCMYVCPAFVLALRKSGAAWLGCWHAPRQAVLPADSFWWRGLIG